MATHTLVLLVVAVLFNLAFAVFHSLFWRMFRWDMDLRGVTLRSRRVILLLVLGMMYVFILVAYLCAAHGRELVETRLGRDLLVGLSLFWFARAAGQGILFGWKFRSTYTWGALFALGGLIHLGLVLTAAR